MFSLLAKYFRQNFFTFKNFSIFHLNGSPKNLSFETERKFNFKVDQTLLKFKSEEDKKKSSAKSVGNKYNFQTLLR